MHRGAAPGGRSARLGVNGEHSRWGLRATSSYGGRYYAPPSPYRSISTEGREVPRPPDGMDLPMRAGSIRADVTRYNEERGGRPMPPPRSRNEAPHSPFFSFYRN